MPPARGRAMPATERERFLWVRQQNERRKGRKGRKPRILRKWGPFRRWREAAETGGNWRKLRAETLLEKLSAVLLSHPRGAVQIAGWRIACGNCGNWLPPAPPARSLRFDAGDLHVLRPFGALLAVLRRALFEAERFGVERELVDQPIVDLGRGDGLVDQRVQPLLDRSRRGLGHGDRQEAGAGEAGEALAEGRQRGIEGAARGQGDGQRPRLVGHHLAAACRQVDEHELDGAGIEVGPG